eukprot:755364-Hanusia_phi.AAC.3
MSNGPINHTRPLLPSFPLILLLAIAASPTRHQTYRTLTPAKAPPPRKQPLPRLELSPLDLPGYPPRVRIYNALPPPVLNKVQGGVVSNLGEGTTGGCCRPEVNDAGKRLQTGWGGSSSKFGGRGTVVEPDWDSEDSVGSSVEIRYSFRSSPRARPAPDLTRWLESLKAVRV